MTFTIAFGWWLFPVCVTCVVAGLALNWLWRQPPAYGYGAIGQGLGEALVLLAATVVICVVWIVYLTVRLWAA